MKVDITYEIIKVPKIIKVDGVVYPNTGRNIDIICTYLRTKDINVLSKLSKVELIF